MTKNANTAADAFDVDVLYAAWENEKHDIVAMLRKMDCGQITVYSIHHPTVQFVSGLDICDSTRLDADNLDWCLRDNEVNREHSTQHEANRHAFRFKFQKANDAILFKLTWGGAA